MNWYVKTEIMPGHEVPAASEGKGTVYGPFSQEREARRFAALVKNNLSSHWRVSVYQR